MSERNEVEQRAKELERLVNQRIADECEDRSPLEWKARASFVVDHLLDHDRWEFCWVTPLGGYPQIAITQYIPPRPDRYIVGGDPDPRQFRP